MGVDMAPICPDLDATLSGGFHRFYISRVNVSRWPYSLYARMGGTEQQHGAVPLSHPRLQCLHVPKRASTDGIWKRTNTIAF